MEMTKSFKQTENSFSVNLFFALLNLNLKIFWSHLWIKRNIPSPFCFFLKKNQDYSIQSKEYLTENHNQTTHKLLSHKAIFKIFQKYCVRHGFSDNDNIFLSYIIEQKTHSTHYNVLYLGAKCYSAEKLLCSFYLLFSINKIFMIYTYIFCSYANRTSSYDNKLEMFYIMAWLCELVNVRQ